MSRTVAEADRGLEAVRRVRAARERDSRLGLARAVTEQQSLAARADALAAGVGLAAARPTAGDPRAYAGHRDHLLALGRQLAAARESAAAADRVVRSSRDHWLADHGRLDSVDLLLERRRADRAADAARVEARAADEVGTDVWRRTGGRR